MYIFDVDGTLTPPRELIDSQFSLWFLDFVKNHKVSLVSGSDYEKTLEQVGSEILNSVHRVYSCAGNAIYKNGKLVSSNSWNAPSQLILDLEHELLKSTYLHRYGNHIEHRIGLLNFSIPGRNAPMRDRLTYKEWDNMVDERLDIIAQLSSKWPNLTITIGGDISIDISPKGYDKSQILNYFNDEVIFFGDRTEFGGNDYALAQAIIKNRRGTYHSVSDWKETWLLLKQLHSETLDTN